MTLNQQTSEPTSNQSSDLTTPPYKKWTKWTVAIVILSILILGVVSFAMIVERELLITKQKERDEAIRCQTDAPKECQLVVCPQEIAAAQEETQNVMLIVPERLPAQLLLIRPRPGYFAVFIVIALLIRNIMVTIFAVALNFP